MYVCYKIWFSFICNLWLYFKQKCTISNVHIIYIALFITQCVNTLSEQTLDTRSFRARMNYLSNHKGLLPSNPHRVIILFIQFTLHYNIIFRYAFTYLLEISCQCKILDIMQRLPWWRVLHNSFHSVAASEIPAKTNKPQVLQLLWVSK